MAHPETIDDFITGAFKTNTGAEANRQAVEKLLVQTKGYSHRQIEVDTPIAVTVGGQLYRSTVDLVVSVQGRRFMVLKCAPGSLASREREVIAAARLLEDEQIPLAVATDGVDALVWESVSGKLIGQGLAAIPTNEAALHAHQTYPRVPLDAERRERQNLIFKSYDSMYVNRSNDPRTVR